MLGITTVSVEPQTMQPEEVDRSMLGKQIAVEGSVSNLSRYNQHAFFQIKQNSSIEVAIFSYPGFLFNRERSGWRVVLTFTKVISRSSETE